VVVNVYVTDSPTPLTTEFTATVDAVVNELGAPTTFVEVIAEVCESVVLAV